MGDQPGVFLGDTGDKFFWSCDCVGAVDQLNIRRKPNSVHNEVELCVGVRLSGRSVRAVTRPRPSAVARAVRPAETDIGGTTAGVGADGRGVGRTSVMTGLPPSSREPRAGQLTGQRFTRPLLPTGSPAPSGRQSHVATSRHVAIQHPSVGIRHVTGSLCLQRRWLHLSSCG